MIRDTTLKRTTAVAATDERRARDRFSCPAELVLSWLHDPETTLRYEVIDLSDGGFRIRSTMPVLKGTTGIASRILPAGTKVDRAVSVVWVRPDGEGGYEVGLEVLGS